MDTWAWVAICGGSWMLVCLGFTVGWCLRVGMQTANERLDREEAAYYKMMSDIITANK